MDRATHFLLSLWLEITMPASVRRRDQRGDVPGWVLITVMTAVVVMALLAVAKEQLPRIFQNAIDSVHG